MAELGGGGSKCKSEGGGCWEWQAEHTGEHEAAEKREGTMSVPKGGRDTMAMRMCV